MTEPEPGTFYGIEEIATEEVESDRLSEPKDDYQDVYRAKIDSHLGKAANLFVQHFGIPKRVLYPACGAHIIDALFPGVEIVYVDPSESGIRLLREAIGAQVKAVALPIDQYIDDQGFDLLFSMNSHAPMEEQLKHLKVGGFVFCNNYFGTQDAERVIELGDCILRAVIEQDEEAQYEPYLKMDGLDPYLEFDHSLPENHVGARRKQIASYYIFSKEK